MKIAARELDDLEDAPRGTFRSSRETDDDDDDREVKVLGQLAHAVGALANASKALAQTQPVPVPIVNVPAPQVTVMPAHEAEPCCWTAEVSERDERGLIKKVTFTPAAR